MSEKILKALMQLFALIGDIHDDTIISSREKNIVRMFLARHLNSELVERYMVMFGEYLSQFNSENIKKGSIQDRKRTSLNAMKILSICEQINEELRQKQKIYVLVQLIDFISLGSEITENELDFLNTVAKAFNIPEVEYLNIKSFIMNPLYQFHDVSRFLVIDNKTSPADEEIKHFCNPGIRGTLVFLHIPSTNTYVLRYYGGEDLYLNGQNIIAAQTYVFDTGASVRGTGINPIYYSEVAGLISQELFDRKVFLDANSVTYEFRNSENGIHDLDFHEGSGKLVGIIGGSGVGKSTTLSVLNGTLKPDSGEVKINGYNLYDDEDRLRLTGLIGFVPQDDLLIEELTVYQNLYYSARLCLSNLSEKKLKEVVDKTLIDLDLEETRDLKVGNPLNKVISGGQRKRVNIALELLREPTILFVDEPTSGLSSVDSETVMNLLKEMTYKGKLVIVNIHQPGSEIYKMFDRIMIIDKGGYQIFYGNPTEAIIYFKTLSMHANPQEDQCVACGNVNVDQILQIVEAKIVDEHGRPTLIRKITPKEWSDKFKQNRRIHTDHEKIDNQILPASNYSIPGLFNQSKIFFIRDFLSKLSDRQYLTITLLGSPVLALLLAWFTKYNEGLIYKFSSNENIPAYLFMCVITSMFFGLMVSSEEIVKDRKLLKRESFLNLSWFSYLNSKIMMMFMISAIQTISFILIGNYILEIKNMTFSYWLVLFTTSCFANVLGLNISSAFNSVITIYIIIPFIIIPQLLFSGVLVKFDKLHKGLGTTQEYVPFLGDLMTARWAFEAMAVRQFKDNDYSKRLFSAEASLSQNTYYALLVDELVNEAWRCGRLTDSSRMQKRDENTIMILNEKLTRLQYHLNQLKDLTGINPGQWINSLNERDFNQSTENEVEKYLSSLKKYFNTKWRESLDLKNEIENSIVRELGNDGRNKLRDENVNEGLMNLALDLVNPVKRIYTPEKIIQKMYPGHMKTSSKVGRAHFYAPSKMIGNKEIDTYVFDLSVIWIESIILYIALYFKVFSRIVAKVGNIRVKKSE
jgi:ABC transport system ATP-binding/permease protein